MGTTMPMHGISPFVLGGAMAACVMNYTFQGTTIVTGPFESYEEALNFAKYVNEDLSIFAKAYDMDPIPEFWSKKGD